MYVLVILFLISFQKIRIALKSGNKSKMRQNPVYYFILLFSKISNAPRIIKFIHIDLLFSYCFVVQETR
jgi:hypothetical protein